MRALDDIKVLDLTIARAGPTCVRQLGDWGASITRIESPAAQGGFNGDHFNSDYMNLHRNKRVLSLDLKQEEGRDILRRLVADADVLVESFRPPVKKRLGIDFEALSTLNKRLIYASISGFGQHGPYSDKGSVDQIIQGMAGLMSITGLPGQGPVRAGVAIADLAAGHQLAIGILVALHDRQRSGEGQWVHVSLLEALISFLDFQAVRWTVDGVVPGQVGNDHPTAIPMGTFATADGHINIAASSDNLWQSLCRVLDTPELLDEPAYATGELRSQNRAALNAQLQATFSTRPTEVWWKLMDEAGIPCGPINTIDKVFVDPQVEYLAMTTTVEHATRGAVDILRQPVNMTRTAPQIDTASPLPDQHRDEVLRELGFSAEKIDDLAARGVV